MHLSNKYNAPNICYIIKHELTLLVLQVMMFLSIQAFESKSNNFNQYEGRNTKNEEKTC